MLNPRHFLRMARWARKPPGERRVKFVFGIIALCLIIAGVEALVGWPEALTVNSMR